MPASHIIILVLTCVLIALALFTAYHFREADLYDAALNRLQERHRRLIRRYRAEYARANDAEDRVLSRNIFDEVANEYAWLQFPAEPGASASVYHFMEADLYDAALNSHEVR